MTLGLFPSSALGAYFLILQLLKGREEETLVLEEAEARQRRPFLMLTRTR